MPAKSEAQRRMLNARFGHEWVKAHGFDNKGKLPMRVKKKVPKKKTKKRSGPRTRNSKRGKTITYGSY